MKKILSLFCFLWASLLIAQEQVEVLPPNYIKSIIFNGNSNIKGNPVIKLGESIHLEFDDIIGDEANYYYIIEHFNYDWTPSELIKSEYLNGFDNVRIVNYNNSYNTLQGYTHYNLNIPNKDTQSLKVSGNYLLKVFTENDELVFSRKFMVYRPIAQVKVAIKRSRDLKYINSRQVVNFSINSPDFLIRNPESTIKILITKNHNLKSAIENIKPQYTIGNELIYKYDQETSFLAGNEYLQFDSKDIRATTIDIGRIELNELYSHFLFADRSRATEPYTYNPDINGQFVVRTLQGENASIEAEYVWTHFKLQNYDPLDGGELHLYGAFNNFELDDSTLMKYNKTTGLYENTLLLKQGFYNYKYVLLNKNGFLDEGFISGNFDVTENEYQVLVYFRDLGARFDQIIGFGNASSLNISN
ncbi:uncharacterized protein DUF5103 [Gillisia sp. Hel_I_86]|uniref:type IX secretion system plug protein n=1 Tax=Gillisia sp. Hel_I_86 TaxID=1249981 RepID=UPI00119A71F3|nr:DUF5103 domain-containing protein [Gillisia sp. Hel_I_86]TVZ27345.1 uncharacterized protein DUF5103 [Gillisia sp. Hel_I_86]